MLQRYLLSLSFFHTYILPLSFSPSSNTPFPCTNHLLPFIFSFNTHLDGCSHDWSTDSNTIHSPSIRLPLYSSFNTYRRLALLHIPTTGSLLFHYHIKILSFTLYATSNLYRRYWKFATVTIPASSSISTMSPYFFSSIYSKHFSFHLILEFSDSGISSLHPI